LNACLTAIRRHLQPARLIEYELDLAPAHNQRLEQFRNTAFWGQPILCLLKDEGSGRGDSVA